MTMTITKKTHGDIATNNIIVVYRHHFPKQKQMGFPHSKPPLAPRSLQIGDQDTSSFCPGVYFIAHGHNHHDPW